MKKDALSLSVIITANDTVVPTEHSEHQHDKRDKGRSLACIYYDADPPFQRHDGHDKQTEEGIYPVYTMMQSQHILKALTDMTSRQRKVFSLHYDADPTFCLLYTSDAADRSTV